MGEPITQEALFDARVQFAGKLEDCAHCGGFSKPDPRRAPTRSAPALVIDEGRTLWQVRCFNCSATVTSELDTAADAVATWNRRTGAAARKPEMLPFVDLVRSAEISGMPLTPQAEAFARRVQTDVLRLNARPTC